MDSDSVTESKRINLATISRTQLREIGRQVCNSVTDLARFDQDIKSEDTHEAVGRAVLEIINLAMTKGFR